MFLSQAAQADMIFDVGDERWKVPPFTLGDFVDWGAEVDADRLARATAGMDEKRRFQFVAFHDVPPSQLPELLRLVNTPAGVQRVCGRCLAEATVIRRGGKDVNPPEPVGPVKAAAVITANIGQLSKLAAKLAACEDGSRGKGDGSDGGEPGGDDPLTGGGSGGSPNSPATPSAISPSSPPSTPDSTPSP